MFKKIILNPITSAIVILIAAVLLHTENPVCQIISVSLLAAYAAGHLWIVFPDKI